MNFTEWFVVGTGIIWLAYDVYVVKVGKSTESQVIRDWGQRWTYFPFVMGVLVSHWFINLDHPPQFGWMIVLPAIIALVVWDLFWRTKPRERVWFRYPGLWLLIGEAAGLLWSQTP